MLTSLFFFSLSHGYSTMSSHNTANTESFSTSSHSRRLLQYGNAPRQVLPATHFIPLTVAADGNHYHMAITYNNQSLKVIIDTGSADLMVMDAIYCDQIPSHPPNSCYVSGTVQDTSATRLKFQITIDNEQIVDVAPKRISGELGLNVSIMGTTGTRTVSRSMDALLSYQLSFDSVRPPQKVLHSFPDSAGLIGLAYQLLSNFGVPAGLALLSLDTDPIEPTFSLDLNPEGKESRMLIGGIDEAYRNRLIWGVADYSPFHTFLVRDLRVCGVSLVDNFTDYAFRGLVDTGSTCLGLPAEIFDSLMSWLPVRCDGRAFQPGFRTDMECSLLPDVPTVLPTLSFTMAVGGAPSPALHIPLEDLLLENRSLCIRRMGAIVPSDGSISFGLIDLAFGNRVLHSLFTTFYVPTGQLAMANKNPDQTVSNIQCIPRTICKGMQTAYTAYNQCVDPFCDEYYFFALDNDSKMCYLTSTFHIIAGVLLALFLGGEVIMTELELWLEKRIGNTFQRTPL